MKISQLIDKKYAKISIYVIITAFFIFGSFRILNNLNDIVDYISGTIHWILVVLKPVVIGFVIAYLLDPVVAFFERQFHKVKFIKKKVRTLSVVCTFLFIIIFLTILVSLVVSSITKQLQVANFDDFIIALNKIVDSSKNLYSDIMNKLSSLNIESTQISSYVKLASNTFFSTIINVLNGVALSFSNISDYLTTLVFGIIIGIYFMLDKELILGFINRVSNALLNKRVNTKIHELLNDLDTVFSGYLKGQLSDVGFMMVAVSFTLMLTGTKFAILIGILTGLANLIPYLGGFVAYGLTIIVCLMNGEYQVLLVSIIALFIVQNIDANIVGPKLLSSSIKIHPLLVIIFLIVGSAVGGLFGMLLAVPVGGFIKVEFMKWIAYLEKKKQLKVE
ncbi:AI-2E family transporter [Anaeromicropila herbilytica]|uniref:AI-2E family transporter n=1 Tax=Anaeromicropila herbilytica TaxID=2785025 RepID=A0A7R7EI09_9FIRM|nr:AI-2E family transporter [Anaeromicropila herbilytica]BCN28802.1 AI-2E family transporter [Anaeromicropila herbilytica]